MMRKILSPGWTKSTERVPRRDMNKRRDSFAKRVLNTLYPGRCPVCGRILKKEETYICSACGRTLPWISEPVCLRCGKPIGSPERELCADCERTDHTFDEGRSVFLYERGIRQAVNRLKFYNHREYVPFFSACLYAKGRPYLSGWKIRCIIPVPMHPKKRAERGFDQAQLLADGLSQLSGIPVLSDVLLRTRYTKSSRKLGREHRLANLRGAFRVREGAVIPEPVLLIDDIYTTGTTMDNAARALRKAGVRQIFFLTLCSGRGAE